jgi:uncharacterized protein (TIGR00288 family)
MPESERSEHSLAVFVDFENLALGFQSRRDRFDIHRVLKRLLEKGKIVAKKAYADWNRYSGYTGGLHEAAIELIEIPHRGVSGKNSADIHLCVDAMDLAYSKEHIDTFVIVSGDSDFSPLVSKLKELGKHLIGLGMQGSTSDLLRDNCDEFIYYEDLGDKIGEWSEIDASLPEPKRKAFALLLDACLALRRENKMDLMSSVLKDTMKRMKPSFNETYHGYRTFSQLLEDAQRHGLVTLEINKRSGTYVVTRFGEELKQGAPPRRTREPQEGRPRRSVSRTRQAGDLERRPLRRRPTELIPEAGPLATPDRPVRGLPSEVFDETELGPRQRIPMRAPLASEPPGESPAPGRDVAPPRLTATRGGARTAAAEGAPMPRRAMPEQAAPVEPPRTLPEEVRPHQPPAPPRSFGAGIFD